MNGHAKRTIQTLEALDFQRDEDASSRGVYVYFHANDPDAKVKVFAGLSEIAAKKIRNRADQIVGLASAGEAIPASIRENARIRRQNERAEERARRERHQRELAPFQAAADRRAAHIRDTQAIARAERHRREIEDLMRPGRG